MFAAEYPVGRRYRSTAVATVLQVPALSSKCGRCYKLRGDEGDSSRLVSVFKC